MTRRRSPSTAVAPRLRPAMVIREPARAITVSTRVLVCATAFAFIAAQPPLPRPVPAIEGILAAFDTHTIVAMPDAHGSDQAHAFLLSLIRDARFIEAVDDIVVEFGNARYQDIADRFVNGDEVPEESLRLVWRNHTQPSISADFTHHRDILMMIRSANRTAPRGRKLRVLLGDPPIDWDVIQDRSQHFKWIEMRDAYPAAVLQTEVIAKQRRALLVYGTGHLQRQNVASNFEMEDWRSQTVVSLVERAGPTRIFTIAGTNARALHGWQPPVLARIRGTSLGAVDASEYFGPPGRVSIRNGQMVPVPEQDWRRLRAEEQFDAVLYFGPAPPRSAEPLSATLCDEPGYLELRLKRIALAGLPPPEVARVNTLCGKRAR